MWLAVKSAVNAQLEQESIIFKEQSIFHPVKTHGTSVMYVLFKLPKKDLLRFLTFRK